MFSPTLLVHCTTSKVGLQLLLFIPRNNRSRVNTLSVLTHSQVQVRARAVACRADHADLLARAYRFSLLNRSLLQVAVQRGIAVAVIYHNIVAVAVLIVANLSNLTDTDTVRRLTVQIAARAANVNTVMVGTAVSAGGFRCISAAVSAGYNRVACRSRINKSRAAGFLRSR